MAYSKNMFYFTLLTFVSIKGLMSMANVTLVKCRFYHIEPIAVNVTPCGQTLCRWTVGQYIQVNVTQRLEGTVPNDSIRILFYMDKPRVTIFKLATVTPLSDSVYRITAGFVTEYYFRVYFGIFEIRVLRYWFDILALSSCAGIVLILL